jgi:hypothetical protein
MKVGEVQELVARVAAVDADCADWAVLQGAVGQLRTLKSWVEGREVLLARLVAKVSSFPEKSLAEAGKSNLREGERLIKRAGTVEQIPTLGEALEAGRVSAGHVDVLTRVLAQLQTVPRQQLIDAGPSLVAIAENTTADEFARTVGDQTRGWSVMVTAWSGWSGSGGRSGSIRGWIARPGWVAGQQPGTRKRWSAWRI